jgi:hypothetical protein
MNESTKKNNTMIITLVLLLLCCGISFSIGKWVYSDKSPKEEWLFVVDASYAISQRTNKDQYILRLPVKQTHTTGFTDRPVTKAMTLTSKQLVSLWSPTIPGGFAESPPNAWLQYGNDKGNRKAVLLQIIQATIKNDNLELLVTVKNFSQIDKKLGGKLSGKMERISLFIDPGTGSLTQLIALG